MSKNDRHKNNILMLTTRSFVYYQVFFHIVEETYRGLHASDSDLAAAF